MRKSTFFAALLGLVLFFGSLVPSADAQWGWRRAMRRGYYNYPAYYGNTYSYPGYYGSSYYSYPYSYGSGYYTPGYSYSYGSPGYYGSYYPSYGNYYSSGYYYPGYYGRGYVATPWANIGW